MKNYITLILSFIIFTCLIQNSSNACTTFQLNNNGHVFVGKNYDWVQEDCVIVVNKRGVLKKGMLPIGERFDNAQLASWTSEYGNITFNQFARDLPFGGINEAGLVVEILALQGTKYPAYDSKPSIWSLQWIQYLLDSFSTVKEIVTSKNTVRISPAKIINGCHLFVSDKDGNAAILEFVDGKLVCYTEEKIPYKVLTNSPYEKSLEYLKKDKTPWIDRKKSIERFITAAKMVNNYKPEVSKPPIDYSFDILKNASWYDEFGWGRIKLIVETKWSIVYDINYRRIYFRTLKNQNVRVINLDAFDFSCATPVKVLDINAQIPEDVKDFPNYTQKMNRDLVRSTSSPLLITGLSFWRVIMRALDSFIRGTPFLPNLSDEEIDVLSQFPDTTVCTN